MDYSAEQSVNQHLWLVTPVLVTWIAGTIFSFWWFEVRDLQSFSPSNSTLFGEVDSQNLENNLNQLIPTTHNPSAVNATVLHFWDPACSCSKFNEPHVRELIGTYQEQNIHFIVVTHDGTAGYRETVTQKAAQKFGANIPVVFQPVKVSTNTLPSSPATAIYDSQGQLAYFGPYSNGVLCRTSDGAFVENVLDNLLQDNTMKIYNTLAFGCYCNWTTKT